MLANLFTLLKDWGLWGCLGLGGCYLILGSIIGVLGPLPFIFPSRHRLKSKIERVLLALFGFLLAAPIIIYAYGESIYGKKPKFLEPGTPEYVKDSDSSKTSIFRQILERPRYSITESNFHPELLLTNVSYRFPNQRPRQDCQIVESFGLTQRSIRRLQYKPFQNQVFVYVGDIHYFGASSLYVFTDKSDAWPATASIPESEVQKRIDKSSSKEILRFKRTGQELYFGYGGKRYRLTVKQIYSVLFGADKIAVEICEML
ncbi:MAG: hypothetical protein L0226_04405 [Acidobacteria bacterium]|nr:hypothetical protein [Acidobacteriota bacterium]